MRKCRWDRPHRQRLSWPIRIGSPRGLRAGPTDQEIPATFRTVRSTIELRLLGKNRHQCQQAEKRFSSYADFLFLFDVKGGHNALIVSELFYGVIREQQALWPSNSRADCSDIRLSLSTQDDVRPCLKRAHLGRLRPRIDQGRSANQAPPLLSPLPRRG
jgi:hypothetical protein